MTTIHRIANSCLTVTTEDGTSLLDPGFFSWESDEVDLQTIGDVQRVFVTHAHADHVHPEFVAWLVDRGDDVVVYSNESVGELLAKHNIAVEVEVPVGAGAEDVLHELTPMGDTPPNRSWTIEGVLTHPGDSFEPSYTAPILALPLMAPYGSTTQALSFAQHLAPAQVVPIHDFYLSASGRAWVYGMASKILSQAEIEFVHLDWGDSYTI